jgi:tripartite-type tricarboxylate transporter receptor subunit TctC
VASTTRTSGFALCAAALVATMPGTARAADFYAGKTIELTVGGNPGGGYDVYARAFARHMPDHIPGHPHIIVKNMIGGASVKSAVYMATIAPKDGTAFAAVYPGAVVDPLFGEGEKRYDPTHFAYIGTGDVGTRTCITYAHSKTKTFEDARKYKTLMGASQAGGSTQEYARMSNTLGGAKFEVIAGYKGTVDVLLAMERGELDGVCGFDWTSLTAQRPQWITEKKVNILVQYAMQPRADLTAMGVPEFWKYVTNEQDRKAAEVIIAQQIFARPYLAPPGTNPEAVKILRDAFMATAKDPAFLADAQKVRIEVNALDGEKVQDAVAKLYASSAADVANAKRAMTGETKP